MLPDPWHKAYLREAQRVVGTWSKIDKYRASILSLPWALIFSGKPSGQPFHCVERYLAEIKWSFSASHTIDSSKTRGFSRSQ